jgi:hypothetical protein
VALAPGNFGALADALLIGNFGDGHINGYNAMTGKFINTMHGPQTPNGLQGRSLPSMACGAFVSAVAITGKMVTPTRCISLPARMASKTVCSVPARRTVYTAPRHIQFPPPGRDARGRD